MAGLSNQDILRELDAAVKSFTYDDMGQSILTPAQQAQFVRTIQDKSVVLDMARYMNMTRRRQNIDRIGFSGRVLHAGRIASDTDKRELTEPEFATPDTATNELDARELQGVAPLGDDTLLDNIEQGRLEQTLQDLFAEAAGRDIEEFALLADTDIPYATDDVLHQTDGWLKLAANKIYGVDRVGAAGTRDFNPDFDLPYTTGAQSFDPATNQDTTFSNVEKMLDAMLKALPDKYLQDEAQFAFMAPRYVHDAYWETLRRRGGKITDDPQTGRPKLAFKGVPVVKTPMLDRAASVASGGAGRACLLANPSANMVYGVFRRVIVEPDRLPKKRRTDFVLTFWADVHYEDQNAAVAAFLDRPKP